MTLSPQWLDELRARTVLSALIGRSVKITRAGREWKACCPFHNEKTPSFTINDDKGFYHCFGCGAHGDAIRWMTDQRGLPFMDAVKELAAAAGMDVPAPDPRSAERAEKAHGLRDVTEASARWFRERLMDAEGGDARSYLEKRGLSRATVEAFNLGFAPDARGRLREVLSEYGDDLAIEAGMLILPPDDAPKNRQEPYDRFRGRLMIPIRDTRGRTIAFGGRILGAGEPKYLNSPDTPLFDKGRILYNLDRAAAAARAAGRLIIVEGYLDVIALAQAGIAEAVAPLGTALTEAQIELAWRQVSVPLLAFDGDAAGQRAALRAATRALPLLKPGHSLAFITMPAGQDPDDVVRSGGKGAFDRLANAAVPLVDLLWQTALAARRDDTPEARAGVRAQLMQWAETIADRDVAALYRQAFRDRLDDAFFAGNRKPAQTGNRRPMQGARRNFATPPPERPPSPQLRGIGKALAETACAAVLAGLLRQPQRIAHHAEALVALPFPTRELRGLADAMIDAALTRDDVMGLDTEGLLAILANGDWYNSAQVLLRADGANFSFTRTGRRAGGSDTDDRIARDSARAATELDLAIHALITLPELDRACADADARAFGDLTEETLAEQQRCRAAREEALKRLVALAGDGQDGGT